ncbi:MAG: phosphate acyltransferase PlsX [Bacteroidetes bacterium 43-93]|nr:phosphate acyltransferase PlsX [Bacteroidota bacterium]OJW98080.1 MAG: phosphate acyltransferase PlsX [Bacteroidetes bacterium 43-93]
MKIGFDFMGGDYAPSETIAGVHQFFQQDVDPSVHLVLIGDLKAAASYLSVLEPFQGRYTLVDAPETIGMHEHPTKALKEKQNSSIAIGFGMLQMQKIDAFCSAGNTGAMMVGAMYTVKNIEGILRPTIASPIPRADGKWNLLLDVGINADCKPENLVQFAQLGSLYMQKVYGVENPKVGLLNIGEEEGKGNILCQATYPLLNSVEGLNFVGNIEGRDVFKYKAEVVVCEGFVGNVLLKAAESIYDIFRVERKVDDELLDTYNFEVYGGTPILGINKPVVIGHGVSHALAFKNMLNVAARIVDADLMNVFKAHFAQPITE